MVTVVPEPPVEDSAPHHDHIVVLEGATWADYQRLLEIRGERAGPRLAYLEGRLEIMSLSRYHESITATLARLVEAWCIDRGIDLTPVGSWTLENKEADRGAEPDECYVFGAPPIDTWTAPDLAIEVVWTSGGLSKREIYRELHVPEVWTWKKGKISVHRLSEGQYGAMERSIILPDIDPAKLAGLATVRPMTRAIRTFRNVE